MGFLAVRDTDAGDEVVWDYKVDDVEWSGCTLKGGVINPSKKMSEKEEKEKGSESDSLHCEVVMHHSGRRLKRRLCYCPIEGCTSRPLAKLSNHLAQVHHLSPQERAKYLGVKRKFASQRDVEDRVPRTTPRRSQRKLTAFVGKYGDSPVEVSESDSDEAGRSEMDSEPPREASTEEDSSLPTDESGGSSIIGRLKISDRDMETDDHDLPESKIQLRIALQWVEMMQIQILSSLTVNKWCCLQRGVSWVGLEELRQLHDLPWMSLSCLILRIT